MDLESGLIRKDVKNEMRRIRQRIDKEKNPAKKAKMIKSYLEMFEALENWEGLLCLNHGRALEPRKFM